MSKRILILVLPLLALGIYALEADHNAKLLEEPGFPVDLNSAPGTYMLIQAGVDSCNSGSDSTTVTFDNSFSATTYSFTWSQDIAESGETRAVPGSLYVLAKAVGTCIIYTDSSDADISWQAIGWSSTGASPTGTP
jgi:hypothetical protein